MDLQGKPIAGVTIEPGEIFEPEGQDLNSWITASRSAKAESYVDEPKYLTRKLWSRGSGIPTTITTDRDGWFSIAGVGRERLIRLKLSGPTVQTKEIAVLTRPSDPFRVTNARGSTDWGVSLYYGDRFTHAAAPTKPVMGIVKDKDTGRPLAGVRIECDRTAEYPVRGSTGIETTTDSEGRYRLIGMPKGRGNHIVVIPAKNQPYLRSGLQIPDSPGLEPTVFDISLTHGIAIQGKVIDKATGKPLKAFVEYNAFRDNPNLSTAPGFAGAHAWGVTTTEPDGSFQVVGLPGHGLLSAMYYWRRRQVFNGDRLAKESRAR